jgi:hypothetical protein
MSTTRFVIEELDVVALLNPVSGWPAGTQGTVIVNDPDYKLVEICNEFGEGLDELDVPPEQLKVVWSARTRSSVHDLEETRHGEDRCY